MEVHKNHCHAHYHHCHDDGSISGVQAGHHHHDHDQNRCTRRACPSRTCRSTPGEFTSRGASLGLSLILIYTGELQYTTYNIQYIQGNDKGDYCDDDEDEKKKE